MINKLLSNSNIEFDHRVANQSCDILFQRIVRFLTRKIQHARVMNTLGKADFIYAKMGFT